MLISANVTPPRAIAWSRVLLAAVALGLSYFLRTTATSLLLSVLGLYIAYALLIAIRGRAHGGPLGLLLIIADTVYFLIVASYGGNALVWLACFFFLFIMAETLIFYSTVEVIVIAVVSAAFCAVLIGGWPVEQTVVASGALAAAFAFSKRRQAAQIDTLRDRLVAAELAAEKAAEGERVRIASDFHDGPLQSFISLSNAPGDSAEVDGSRSQRRHGRPQTITGARLKLRSATSARSSTACGPSTWMARTWSRRRAAPPRHFKKRAAFR